MNKVRELGYEIIIKKEKDLTVSDDIKDIDILICYNPFDTFNIDELNNLKWIQLSSIGIDQVPIDILKTKNIILTNNKGGYSIPIGEWIVLKTLELLKNSKTFYNNQNDKVWKIDTSILELYNKTVTFIGTGSIAKEASKRLQGFDANIIGVNTSGKPVEYFNNCYSIKDLNKVLSFTDILILSIPYTHKTHHLINDTAFNDMKNESYIINISRGNIIDENSLIKNIENKKIKGAALDVFENEPLSENSPLWNYDNVYVTPHNSWVSEMRNDRRFEAIYNNLKSYINNENLINVIDLNKGY